MEDRWQLVLPHREYLIRLARSRGVSAADAEDCVQEAMLRCVQYADLDETRVAAFLTTIVSRLCADAHRNRARDDRLAVKLTAYDGVEPAPDERICEQAEAEWVSHRVAALPERQRVILAAKADGQSCGEIAERLAVSYKVVESALSRARAHLRAALVASLGFLGVFARRARGPAAATTSVTLVALGTAALVLHGPLGDGDEAGAGAAPTPPAVRGHVLAGGPVVPDAVATPRAGLRSPEPAATATAGARVAPAPGATYEAGPVVVSTGPSTERPLLAPVECARRYWYDPRTNSLECHGSPPPGAFYLIPSPSEGPE